MAGRSTSGIGSSYASSTHTLSNSTMPSVDNVGVGTQNPSSALPPKPKKSEQTSIVWDHLPKQRGVILRILNHNAIIVRNCLVVIVKG
jgi:hypothetical protein